ncbi:hypothetical protein LS482_11560 [Sinomicrobium kalidii]|uniref:hypothetical protein n=1 Tax=Sinomicrobium kalidii TaxID=2900738 RepID=UPI001E509B4D|nr:hypothetical protein [Sinomicrobium kalidii]UGU14346.1 hypothetical protein LS482_11560 [Sinomicrobium kalidii]
MACRYHVAGFVEESRAKNRTCIDFTTNALKKLGLQTAKSHTNFLYFEPEGYPGNFREAMKKHNILVSNLTTDNKEKIRVSMGTGTEMETFVKVIRQILK